MSTLPSCSTFITVENESLTMQELSDCIEEIVSTPDISYLLCDSSDSNDLKNVIDSKASKKVLICDVEFSTSNACSITELEHTQKFIPGNVVNNLNVNNTSQFHDMTPTTSGYSNLILPYCSTCKKGSRNYINSKCQDCQSIIMFQCLNCTCIYKRYISIQNHIKYECYSEKNFYCSECSYVISSKTMLAKHIKSQHPNMYTTPTFYRCPLCEKKFKNQNNMISHQKTCGVEKILHCEYCLFKTKSKSGLAIHVNRKHRDLNPQNSHACPECGKKFKNLTFLNRHIKIMCSQKLNFGCDHCEFKMNRKFALAQHMQQTHPELFLKTKFLC